MKTLVLFRHAKSDWGADYGSDHDRPLNRRGRLAAPRMGRLLEHLDQLPERIVTSSALRAHETVRLAAEAGHWRAPVEVSGGLYGASPRDVLEVIHACPDDVSSLLLAGHEPTWSATAGGLVGGAAFRFPTAAMVSIRFSVDHWRQVDFGAGTLSWFLTPKLVERIEVRKK